MGNASAWSVEDFASIRAGGTKEEDTGDKVLIVEGREDDFYTPRVERHSKIGSAFKIILYKELQGITENLLMEKGRTAKA